MPTPGGVRKDLEAVVLDQPLELAIKGGIVKKLHDIGGVAGALALAKLGDDLPVCLGSSVTPPDIVGSGVQGIHHSNHVHNGADPLGAGGK